MPPRGYFHPGVALKAKRSGVVSGTRGVRASKGARVKQADQASSRSDAGGKGPKSPVRFLMRVRLRKVRRPERG